MLQDELVLWRTTNQMKRRWGKKEWDVPKSKVYIMKQSDVDIPKLTGSHVSLLADYEFAVNWDAKRLSAELKLFVQLLQLLLDAAQKWRLWNARQCPQNEQKLSHKQEYFKQFWFFKQMVAQLCVNVKHWRTFTTVSYFMRDMFEVLTMGDGHADWWWVTWNNIVADGKLINIQINENTGVTDCPSGLKHLAKYGFHVAAKNKPAVMIQQWHLLLIHIVQLRMCLLCDKHAFFRKLSHFETYWAKWIEILECIQDVLSQKNPWVGRPKQFWS